MFEKCFRLLITFTIVFVLITGVSYGKPIKIRDFRGKEVIISKKPKRVVSLVPSVTEVLFVLGAGKFVKKITYHNTYPPETVLKDIAGGFFNPSVEEVEKADPELIFISKIHKNIKKVFGKKCIVIELPTNSIEDSFKNIELLGQIFDCEQRALELIKKNKEVLDTVRKKIAKIPQSRRKRVIRLMGRAKLRVPGDNSFQNEFIKLAGGIPPKFGKDGSIIDITTEQWKNFDPDVIYGCGEDLKSVKKLLKDFYKKGTEVVNFPCVLTCRASTNIGYFVSWLAAKIYPGEFGKRENLVLKEEVYKKRTLKISLPIINKAEVKYSHIYDFTNQTLIVDFKKPVSIVSTLEGFKKNIKTVGNHYFPAQTWAFGHKEGLTGLRKRVYKTIGVDSKYVGFLFTGAKIDNISVQSESFKDMKVYALVTAGVRGNAQRMSRDKGLWYEPGTINIIILSNMRLSQRAMTRTIITATEAKTAALMDMDIRSSYLPKYFATGTGTDNIIVCEGTGFPIDNAGGHSKMGELIAKAVYKGVTEAVFRQNGIVRGRNIFHRLKERKLTISKIVNTSSCECSGDKSQIYKEFELLLLKPRYSSFLEMAFAVSDAYEAGHIKDISIFKEMCREIVFQISGKKVNSIKYKDRKDRPLILNIALSAILNGLNYRF
jgi:adenosylcobinamide amidohydrolase/ABC-type Fe3+-hydroxamate transport system substrate-binding protein